MTLLRSAAPLAALLTCTLAAACGGSFGDPPIAGDATGPDAGSQPDPDPDPILDGDGDGVADSVDNCPSLANTTQTDGDGDLYGDACDCEPADPMIAADLLVADPLDADRGLVAPATGFPPTSWSFIGGAYAQDRLGDDAADAAFINLPEVVGDVRVRVVASSTEIESFDDDDLRQLFLVARASATATSYSALGCGAEIVEALADTRKTSIIAQAGSPTTPSTTARIRSDREALQEGQEFDILLELRGGQMTCQVTIDGTTTTASIADAPASVGAVGFFTRETRATFRDLQVCSYR